MDLRTREQWGAEFDVNTLRSIVLPRPRLFVHHTAGNYTDDPNDDMLTVERIDINRFGKPSYKWVIHPSGVVLVGTTTHRSPDTYGYNDDLSICFMGNFENEEPTDAAMLAARELMVKIKGDGLLAQGFQLLGHRDVYATACPGANLYPRLGELLIPPPNQLIEGVNMNTVVMPSGHTLITVIGVDNHVWLLVREPDGSLRPWQDLGGKVRNPATA